MLLAFETAKFVVKRALYLFPGFNGMFFTMSLGAYIGFKAGNGKDDAMVIALIVSCVLGFVAGAFVRYRSKFSISYALYGAIYFYALFALAFGGAAALMAADISGASEKRWAVFIIYELSIIFPLWFAVRKQLKNLDSCRGVSESEWKEKFKGVVNFDTYIVMPNQSAAPVPGSSPLASVWMWAPVTVNVPLLFQIYTGSKNNAIFLAIPLLVGTFAYLSLKVIGPKIANLCVLRQYEKQTGRRFVSADYEKIQELRRTFFLSRWLMKDYRPVAKP